MLLSSNDMCRIFTDLDNTVIFSHKYDIGSKVLTELLNGKEQSYMPENGYRQLQNLPKDMVIPVTSRTKAQYNRVQLYKDKSCTQYSLIDNGAILLVNGAEDIKWTKETEKWLKNDIDCMILLTERYKDSADLLMQDGFMLRVKGNVSTVTKISEAAEKENLMVFESAGKTYICPRQLTKGNAIKRFKKKHQVQKCICAGDSIIDISMIRECDRAYFPTEIKKYIPDMVKSRVSLTEKFKIAETIFSKEIFDEI